MSSYISAELRRLVASRANGSCEYCLIHEDDTYLGCQVDHIISEKHDGATESENLAYACALCNRSKGSDIGSIAASTGELTRLFNPRTDHSNLKSPFNLTLGRQALEAVTEAGLTPAEKSPNIMHIRVKAADDAKGRSVILTAWLECPSPSGTVTVWRQEKTIASFGRIKPEAALRQVRQGAGKFFETFRGDVQRAKAKSKTN